MFQRFVFWSSAVFLIVAGAWGAGVRPARALAQGAESTIDKAILDAMRWRSIGPLRGGRSIAVSGVKGRPKEGYFGAVGGGLWKTIDGGLSWTPVTDGQITTSSVGAVAVSESNPDIVFIGTGESCIRGNIMGGDGVYKSIDAGKTWTHVGFSDSEAISKIRIHPTNPDIVFVADFGSGNVRVGVTGAGPSAFRQTEMEKALSAKFAPEAVAAIKVKPDGLNNDLHASPEYRAHLITVMCKRAVEQALK